MCLAGLVGLCFPPWLLSTRLGLPSAALSAWPACKRLLHQCHGTGHGLAGHCLLYHKQTGLERIALGLADAALLPSYLAVSMADKQLAKPCSERDKHKTFCVHRGNNIKKHGSLGKTAIKQQWAVLHSWFKLQ